MKKLLFFICFAVYSIVAGAQVTQQITQQSPNIIKTAYLTNITCKMMQAYPNPATDNVIIQHHATSERAVIVIASTDGQIMQQRTVLPNTLQTELNIASLKKGIYILKFDDGRGDIRTLKLVKN